MAGVEKHLNIFFHERLDFEEPIIKQKWRYNHYTARQKIITLTNELTQMVPLQQLYVCIDIRIDISNFVCIDISNLISSFILDLLNKKSFLITFSLFRDDELSISIKTKGFQQVLRRQNLRPSSQCYKRNQAENG